MCICEVINSDSNEASIRVDQRRRRSPPHLSLSLSLVAFALFMLGEMVRREYFEYDPNRVYMDGAVENENEFDDVCRRRGGNEELTHVEEQEEEEEE
mmetsp:Transcript_21352/g.24435  ORF Transcript_21352/g.24435 Transcript_21352/m.24435 type:complete len:97 (+) Transcript_21352:30-320(+)